MTSHTTRSTMRTSLGHERGRAHAHPSISHTSACGETRVLYKPGMRVKSHPQAVKRILNEAPRGDKSQREAMDDLEPEIMSMSSEEIRQRSRPIENDVKNCVEMD